MREYKFRIYDIRVKKFIYFDIYSILGKMPSDSIPTLRQWTGLKDKNNQDIYEGDMIRGDFCFGPAGLVEQTLEVFFDNVGGYQWNYWDRSTIEVVGNIFEDSSLKASTCQ